VRRSCTHCRACKEGSPDSCLTGDYSERGITGLDGFARLCQAPCAFEDVTRGRSSSEALHPVAEEHPVLAWAEAFSRGDAVTKPAASYDTSNACPRVLSLTAGTGVVDCYGRDDDQALWDQEYESRLFHWAAEQVRGGL